MKKKYQAPIGMITLAAIGFLFTSYVPLNPDLSAFDSKNGTYTMIVKDRSDIVISGDVVGRLEKQLNSKGKVMTYLDLEFKDQFNPGRPTLDINIGLADDASLSDKVSFRFKENIEGFINGIEGAFAAASIDRCGELPYFSDRGKLFIEKVTGDALLGRFELTLSNSLGQTIGLKGNFNASRE